MSRFSAFGLTLAGDAPLLDSLAPADGSPDITFEYVSARRGETPDGSDPVYTSPFRTPSGDPVLRVYRVSEGHHFRFTDVADFVLSADAIRCRPYASGHEPIIEIYLLGTLLSFWLERQGIPALHASAVVVDGRAVGFLSDCGAGKSTLAACFMQAGHPLLTDDILPVERVGSIGRTHGFSARPGYPQMRWWPEQARHFVGRFENLDLVEPGCAKRRVRVGATGFGAFRAKAAPLACLYVPERRKPTDGTDVRITPLSPPDAVIQLVRDTFAARLVHAMGWQVARLPLFAELTRHVPLRRLSYPSGFEHLSGVRAAILEDLETPHGLGDEAQAVARAS